jgi:hypothetical protein
MIAALLAAFAAGYASAQQPELLGALNTGVNALLEASGVPTRAAARVVPIVSTGGAPAGYAQIVGPGAAVRATKAVISLQTLAANAGTIVALIPVSSVNRKNGALQRVSGVAVDAVIDAHI